MNRTSKSNRGLVLINALLVVAALSAVAVVLLRTAETARNRQFYLSEMAQTAAYLDGFELLLRSQLDLDRSRSGVDHLGEAWAQKNYTVAIDRGTAVGTIRDLQGLFNLNGLAAGGEGLSEDQFKRLLQELGVRESLGTEIIAWLSEDGPQNHTPYLAQTPHLRPSGGGIDLLDQLRLVNGMTPEIFAKLAPMLTAGSAEGAININTAPRAVLQAVMPEIAPAVIGALIAERRTQPFDSGDAIDEYLRKVMTTEEVADFGGIFTTASSWFEADISVQLGQTRLTRRVVFRRAGVTGKTRVEYRFTAKQ